MTLKLRNTRVVQREPTWLTRPHPALEVLVIAKCIELLDGSSNVTPHAQCALPRPISRNHLLMT